MGKNATTRAYGDGYTGGPITNIGKSVSGVTNGTLDKAEFGVFAYYSGAQAFGTWSSWHPTTTIAEANKAPNFMYNQEIKYNSADGYWYYSPVKYWPNGVDAANAADAPSNTATEDDANYQQHKLSFFAYAPYTAETTTAVTADPSIVDGSELGDAGVTNAVKTSNTTGIVAMTKNDEAKDVKVKYVLGNTVSNPKSASEFSAVDLLWGLRGQKVYKETDANNNSETTLGDAYNVDLTKQVVTEKVKFLLKHALSRVGGSTKSTTTGGGTNQICGLKAVVDVDINNSDNNPLTGDDNQANYQNVAFNTGTNANTTLVTINSVKIRDAYTYSHETNSSISETTSDFQTSGWFDIMNGTWSAQRTVNTGTDVTGATYSVEATADETADDGDETYALNPEIKEIGIGEGKKAAPTAGAWDLTSTDPKGVGLQAKNVYADENIPGLLLIPGSIGANTLYVTVDYYVRTADAKLSTGYTEVRQVITNKVQLDNSVLAPNKYYTLVMHLGLTSVKFEAVVADWSYNNGGTYDENGDETETGTADATYVWLPSNVVAYTASANVAADATSYTFDGSSLNLGDFVSGTGDGTVVTAVAVNSSDSKKADLTIATNSGAERTGTATLIYGFGKVTVTITQSALFPSRKQ